MNYSIPRRLAYVVSDEAPDDVPAVYLMPLPDGPPQVLEGSAAVIWMIAADGGADVAEEVAQVVGRPVPEIAGEVRTYLDYLVDAGFLECALALNA